MFTIAHLSDLHIGGRTESVARAAQVVAHVVAMAPAPDVLLVTGDIADHGADDEYATARDLLSAWGGPLLVGTGNHDVREPFARHLLGAERAGPLDQALDVGAHRFLMLDSLVPAVDGVRQDHGLLAPETLAWLDDELAAFGRSRPSSPSTTRPSPWGSTAPTPSSCATATSSRPCWPGIPTSPRCSSATTTRCARRRSPGGRVSSAGGVVSAVTLDQEPLDHIWLDAPPSLAVHLVGDDGRLTTFWRALP